MKNNYSKITNNSTKTIFMNYIDALDIPQIDYFAVGIQNTKSKTSISLMSSSEWQKYFIENEAAAYDPLRKAALTSNRNFICFDEIDFLDSRGKEIMHARRKMGIKNGIILMERFPNFNYMITLGTSFSSFSPYYFIKNYHENIQLIKSDFITMVENEMNSFILKRHLSNGAK